MRRRGLEIRRNDQTLSGALAELLERFLYSSSQATLGSVHIRDSVNVQSLLSAFVIASLPCWLIGTWNLGEQTNFAMLQIGMERAEGWRGIVLDVLGVSYDPGNVLHCFVHGLLYFMPLLIVALATGALCEASFAALRRRPVDDGLFSIAWLYALILPATTPMLQAMLGMAFAIVFGKGIFGGTGRYLVNPSILGLAFLVFSYSDLVFGIGAWIPVPGYDEPTTIELAIEEGGVATLLSVGYDWQQMFVGNQPGPVGVTSALGCLLGAIYLVWVGAASGRIMLGSVIGMIVTVLLLNTFGPENDPMYSVSWAWHMVMGGWAFGTVFLATDPVAAATTNPGRWGFGFLVGALTIIVRVTNPSYYEGAIFAILLATVFSPLIDYLVVERNARRRRMRTERA
ncbi:MAG TPA: RnfABCDGE type electron transport complex subunit D [Gammaproteobacteria bacterium]|nr:RnfABCDGE type electron transport complex subunit D [Gammaproteobacteria bacterium]